MKNDTYTFLEWLVIIRINNNMRKHINDQNKKFHDSFLTGTGCEPMPLGLYTFLEV